MSTSQRVLDSIRRIVRLLREESRASEESVGLSGAQLFVLQKLDAAHPLSLNELAARTLTHQSSVSVVVTRLVERGLVERHPSARDKRRLELSLTTRGRALVSRAPAAAQERIIAAVAALPARAQAQLAGTLESLVDALGVGDHAAPMFFADEATRGPRPGRVATRGGAGREGGRKRAKKRGNKPA